jgi:ketosteroid isomerase-like protein
MENRTADEIAIRELLESWAHATKQNRKDDVLANHSPSLVIFDVLPPMKYDSAESYRRSWDNWQPETDSDAQFELENLIVAAGSNVGFAHCFIRCGGTLPSGKKLEDVVRATFCLEKTGGIWSVSHQHVSKPFQVSSG